MKGNRTDEKSSTAPLNELCIRITKGTTPTTLGHPFRRKGINFVKSEAITGDGQIDTSKFAFIDAETHMTLGRSILQEGDVLFSMTGVYLGKTAVVPSSILPANTNQAVGIIRLDQSKAVPRFIHYVLSSPTCRALVNQMVAQSAQPNFNLKDIGNILIPAFPVAEQLAISYILSRLDAKIELNQQMNKMLEAIGQAIFKRWFVDFEFPNQEGKPYTSSGGEMVYNQELGKGIPSGWQLTTLGKVAEFTRGFSYNGLEKSTIEGDLVFMTLNSIYEGGGFKREFAYLTSNRLKDRHLLNEGDLIIPNTEQTKTGTLLGFPALVEFPNNYGKRVGCFSHHLTKVTPFNEEMKLYLYYYLHFNQVNAIKYHTGSVIWGLDVKGFIENEMILIPNSEVLNAFSEFATQIFRKKLLNNKQSTTLSAMRDSLLPKLMSGKIRVPLEKQEAK